MLYWSNQASAEGFVDLYLGTLSLAAEQTGSYECFFNCSGRTAPGLSLQELWALEEHLEDEFAQVEGYRGNYLRDMLRGVKTLLRVLKGETISYHDAMLSIAGIDLRPITAGRRERVLAEVDEALSRAGYTEAATRDKVLHWYRDNLLQADELPDTAHKYLDILQREMRRILSVPADEHYGRVELVQGVTWAGFSQYEGHYVTNMLLNRESVWKRPTFIDTVSHELYPGHHTWYTMREQLRDKGELPLEASVLGVCSAEELLFEGIPENGASFLGLDDPELETEGFSREMKEKIRIARKILAYIRILEVSACCAYHIEHKSHDEVIADLTKDGWVEPVVAERVFRYFSHPVNGLYYPAYYFGRWIITYAYNRIQAGQRAEFFHICYEEPHSTATFIRRIEELTGEPFDPVTMALN